MPRAAASRAAASSTCGTGARCVSVVGFRFLDTRVLGVPIPFHRNFEEVNLRFYVRRKRRTASGGAGSCSSRSSCRAAAIACAGPARVRRELRRAADAPPRASSGRRTTPASRGRTEWRRAARWEGLSRDLLRRRRRSPRRGRGGDVHHRALLGLRGAARTAATARVPGRAPALARVARPSWTELRCNVGALYGAEFAEALAGRPRSAFVVEGSAVLVRRGVVCSP